MKKWKKKCHQLKREQKLEKRKKENNNCYYNLLLPLEYIYK